MWVLCKKKTKALQSNVKSVGKIKRNEIKKYDIHMNETNDKIGERAIERETKIKREINYVCDLNRRCKLNAIDQMIICGFYSLSWVVQLNVVSTCLCVWIFFTLVSQLKILKNALAYLFLVHFFFFSFLFISNNSQILTKFEWIHNIKKCKISGNICKQ